MVGAKAITLEDSVVAEAMESNDSILCRWTLLKAFEEAYRKAHSAKGLWGDSFLNRTNGKKCQKNTLPRR